MARQKAYHHGDLRQALIENGLALLEELGLEELSLRKLAARVGVSHAAPEHHFPSLRHLLNALAAEGFKAFRLSMTSEMSAAAPTAAQQLRAALRGYTAFAASNPHLFRLMFNKNRLDWDDPVLGEAGQGARDVLAEISRPVAERLGLTGVEGRLSVEHLVWAHAHGYAHLLIDQKIARASACADLSPVPPLDLVQFLLPE